MEDLSVRLASSRDGLTVAEARKRFAHEGANVIADVRPSPLAIRSGRHLVYRFALLFWAGAILALLGEQFTLGEKIGLIAGVVPVNAAFTFWQVMRVERAMPTFSGMVSPHAR